MKFTRKNYLELFLDGIPVIASSKSSNRHTSVIEAGEHAEEYAREINAPGDYEVRVDGGLYYVVKITDIVFDPTIPEPTPPAPEAELALDASFYSGNENSSIPFSILRTGDLNSVVDVDWAITNANATPVTGTERFQTSIASILVTVTAGEVGPTEVGDVTLSNVVTISGSVNNTLGSQFTATFTIVDLSGPGIDILFGPWDHDTEPLGNVAEVEIGGDKVWQLNQNPSPLPDAGTQSIIKATDPLIPGSQYLETTLVKDNGSAHFRTERRLNGNVSADPFRRTPFIQLGGEKWKATEKVWYGWLMRVDEATGGNGPVGFYCQWHTPNTVGNASSPLIAIRGNGGQIKAYRNDRENNAGPGDITPIHYDPPVLNWPAIQGEVHAIIFEIFWDNRTTAEGSEAIYRIWIDDDPAPAFEYLNQRLANYGVTEAGSQPHHPYLKIGLYAVGSHLGVFRQGYDYHTLMGEGGSRQGMLDAMRWDEHT